MNGYANGIQIALFLQRVVVLARIGGREGDSLINMFFFSQLAVFSRSHYFVQISWKDCVTLFRHASTQSNCLHFLKY